MTGRFWAALSRLRLFNLRYLRAHPARTVLCLSVVTVSATLIVAVIGIYGSVGGSVQRLSERVAGDADLEVTGRTDAGLDPSALREISRTEGVRVAVPLVRSPVDVEGERVLLFGTDASALELGSDLSAVVRDTSRPAADRTPDQAAANGSVLLGPALADRVAGREVIDIESMTGEHSTVPVGGTVTGGSAGRVNDGAYVVAPLRLAQDLSGLGARLESVLVLADPGTDTADLRRRLTQELGPQAFVADPAFRADQADDATAMVRNITLLVAMMALAVAGFLIFNTMNMAAVERRGEMASLRALGARQRPIMRDFLAEAVVLALLGAALGSVLGYAVADAAVGSLPPAITDSVNASIELAMPGSAVPAAVVACLGAGVLASWLAARRVSRVRPVEAMRPADPMDLAEGRTAGRTWALVGALLLFVAAMVVAAAFDDARAYGSGALFLLAVIVLGYALVEPLCRATSRTAARFGAVGQLAASSVDRAPRRVWATGMTVCLAVAIGAATTGASQNAVDAASANVSTLSQTEFVVQRSPADVLPVRPLLPATFGRQLAAIHGVNRVTAGQFTYLNLDEGRALLQGISGPSNSTAYQLADPEAQRALLAGSGAVVSRTFAKEHGLAKGDVLTLPTARGEQRVRVADVVDYVSVDAGLVAISLHRLTEWFGPDGASYYEVEVAHGANVASAREGIEHLVREQPYRVNVLTGHESVDATKSAVRQMGALALVLQWVIAAVAALALLNTLMLSVVERRRELGILRALGCGRRYIRRMILAEAAAVSLVGGGAGIVVGTALQYLSTEVMSEVLALDIPFRVTPAALALAVGAILVAMAGAWPPARRAGRLDVIQAIGYE